jgi:hypothetical protein
MTKKTPLAPHAPFDLTQEHADAINALLPSCQYVVGIRHNETGEVRFCPQNLPWNTNSSRHLEFHGFECHEDDDPPCGESQYTVVGIWVHDGSDFRDLNELNDF